MQQLQGNENLLENFGKHFNNYYDTNLKPLYEVQQKQQELQNEKKALENKMNELNIKGMEANRLIESGKQKMESGKRKMETGKQRFETATLNIQQATTSLNNKLTLQFYRIFFGPTANVPEEQVNPIFTKYVDGSLSIEKPKDVNGKHYPKVISMKGIIQYLSDHTDRKGCNFKPFKAEVDDISSLAQYLVSTPRITAVAFSNGISKEGKEFLAKAVELRRGTLKVMYGE